MYKRRDWVFTHNPDTGDITSDSGMDSDDGTSGEEVDDLDSEQEQRSEPESEEDSDDDEEDALDMVPRTMEDLQGELESDEDSEGLEDAEPIDGAAPAQGKKAKHVDVEAIEYQKAAWLQAEPYDRPKGVPLRCLLCKNKLLLNCANFKDHIVSKAHLAAAKRCGVLNDELKQLESIVASSSVQVHAEQTETHMQRLERFQQLKEGLNKKARSRNRQPVKGSNSQCHDGHRSIETSEGGDQPQGDRRQKRKGKSGKRQREAAKAAAEAGGTSEGQGGPSGVSKSEKTKRKKPGKRQRQAMKAAAGTAV